MDSTNPPSQQRSTLQFIFWKISLSMAIMTAVGLILMNLWSKHSTTSQQEKRQYVHTVLIRCIGTVICAVFLVFLVVILFQHQFRPPIQ